MQRAVDARGFLADKFHDVNLAAARPAELRAVLAEHPDGRPDAFALGDFGARLDAAVLPGGLAARGEAGGGVFHGRMIHGREMFLPAFDDQMAILDAGVFQARLGVVLALVIADEACFVAPFGRVGQALVVELIGPDQFPISRRCAAGGRDEGDDGE